MSTLYPLRLQPVYQSYLWGGDKIIRHFQRSAPPGRYAPMGAPIKTTKYEL